MSAVHKWQFAPRFRRHAFGWRSDTPIQRIKEALSEIKQVARKEPILAAEGAVRFLEKLSLALEQVERSSGALGSAVNKAIDTLGDHWGELCVTPELALQWADEFLPVVEHVWSPQASGHGFFTDAIRRWKIPPTAGMTPLAPSGF